MIEYPYKIIKSQYGKIAVPVGDGWNNPGGLVNTIQKNKIYERRTINFIKKSLKGKSMVHCGTCFGDMLPALDQFTENNIFAYEANPLSAWCAFKTIEINQLEKVKLTQIGLGDREDSVDFIIEYQDGFSLAGGCRFVDSKVPTGWDPDARWNNSKKIKVPIKRLDDILDEDIGIIHLDTEGYETRILAGAINLIRKYKPVLILEDVSGKEEIMTEEIIPMGYVYTKTLDRNTIWVCKK